MYEIVFRSQPQLREFDCPLQLGVNKDGGHSNFESPHNASKLNFVVEENDLIIMATDGLFDNMFDEEIAEIADQVEHEVYRLSSGMSLAKPEIIAQKIMDRAYALSLDKKKDSPFALLAKENMMMFSGGRKDDITVLVSRVTRGGGKDFGHHQLIAARPPEPGLVSVVNRPKRWVKEGSTGPTWTAPPAPTF